MEEFNSLRNLTQRVQVPNTYGVWSQNPYRAWFLQPESSNIGYLDPLGYRMSPLIFKTAKPSKGVVAVTVL